jgi:hypothetical protein
MQVFSLYKIFNSKTTVKKEDKTNITNYTAISLFNVFHKSI